MLKLEREHNALFANLATCLAIEDNLREEIAEIKVVESVHRAASVAQRSLSMAELMQEEADLVHRLNVIRTETPVGCVSHLQSTFDAHEFRRQLHNDTNELDTIERRKSTRH
jgi:hypothetical protein